jgi:HEAT repeat protein
MPGRTGLSSQLRKELKEDGHRILRGPTTLNSIVQHVPGHHVFHFLGHGVFRRGAERGEGTSALYLERDDGTLEILRDDEILPKLTAIDPAPYLVFLAACQTATRPADAEHPFIGLGPKLVRTGVPAVVAMQDLVPMDVARDLTGHFYCELFEHGLVDRALNVARNLLFEQEGIDWAIPVLFMRLESGRLFTADPVRTALQAIRTWSEEDAPPLAIEVAHLVGPQAPGTLQQIEQQPAPALDLIQAVKDIFAQPFQLEAPRPHRRGKLIVLVGSHGTAKTTQLRRIARITAEDSLSSTAARQVLPIYVDLTSYATARSGARNAVETLILRNLKEFWPDLQARSISELPLRERDLALRVLVDGSDDLPPKQRREAWRQIQDLAKSSRKAEYLVVIDADHYDARWLGQATDLLVIQPLSPHAVERFLRHPENEPTGSRLYDELAKKQLFDLAAIPWLLVQMLEQAGQELYPHSRAAVLETLVDDRITEIPIEHGMRSRARQTLHALGWAMQSTSNRVLESKDAFQIMHEVRGNREYSLEGLNDALVDAGLTARVGEEGIRFAYPALQAYCCAKAIAGMSDRDQVLDDITASLGRLTRLRWWEETLILLSGVLPRPRVLHRKLLYGARLNEGEEIFLIVRCLLESGEQQIEPDVLNQVVDALVWQLDSTNVRRSARRVRIVHALGQLRLESSVAYLVNLATERVRLDWRGNLAYDLTNVRMAAAITLRRLAPTRRFERAIEEAHAELAHLLRLWMDRDVAALNEHLVSAPIVMRSVAAAALADMKTEEAISALIAAVFDPGTPPDTRWALTDALALLDPARVTQDVIVPLIEAGAYGWYERLAYLIGKIRTQDAAALAFLDRCLHELTRVDTKARAIQSVGWLQDRRKKPLLEKVAMGQFDEIAMEFPLGKATPGQKRYLRSKAIQALAHIGDEGTLDKLREERVEWDTELRQVFYWTSEEIYWRMRLGRSQ